MSYVEPPSWVSSIAIRSSFGETKNGVAYATVVAEHATDIELLSVSDAVMRLDLAAQTVLMFRNTASGELNVIYRRADGNIGWIDPAAAGGNGKS